MPQAPLYPHDDGVVYHSENTVQEEEKPHYIEPQYIIIDDRFKQKESNSSSETGSQEQKGPLSLRFLCVLGLIFCSIFGLGMFLMSLFATVMSACYLFRNVNLNKSMLHFWKLSTHTLIAGFGFVLGLISPTLGLGLIALYFSVTGEVIDNSLLHSIIKRSFNKF